ncbi:MAG: hypothetical protein AB7P18_35835 [Candidatus Binatia bacterium]
MASGLVHGIYSLIVFGHPYEYVHSEKDAPSQHMPGLRHRNYRHGWYKAYGKIWDFTNLFPESVQRKTKRLQCSEGGRQAEEHEVSITHDCVDRIWDYEELPREDRAFLRKCIEGALICILLNPPFLKQWAGVDVHAGKIQRVIDGQEVWEESPQVTIEYKTLRAKAYHKLRWNTQLRRMVKEFSGQYDSAKIL